jgi:hypothetical protein
MLPLRNCLGWKWHAEIDVAMPSCPTAKLPRGSKVFPSHTILFFKSTTSNKHKKLHGVCWARREFIPRDQCCLASASEHVFDPRTLRLTYITQKLKACNRRWREGARATYPFWWLPHTHFGPFVSSRSVKYWQAPRRFLCVLPAVSMPLRTQRAFHWFSCSWNPPGTEILPKLLVYRVNTLAGKSAPCVTWLLTKVQNEIHNISHCLQYICSEHVFLIRSIKLSLELIGHSKLFDFQIWKIKSLHI